MGDLYNNKRVTTSVWKLKIPTKSLNGVQTVLFASRRTSLGSNLTNLVWLPWLPLFEPVVLIQDTDLREVTQRAGDIVGELIELGCVMGQNKKTRVARGWNLGERCAGSRRVHPELGLVHSHAMSADGPEAAD